jgi:hypothetical protein
MAQKTLIASRSFQPVAKRAVIFDLAVSTARYHTAKLLALHRAGILHFLKITED